MFLQVDGEVSVGVEAFSRIAPAVPVIANVVISENLFEVLSASTGGRLHFFVYDKYIAALERYFFYLSLHITTLLAFKELLIHLQVSL